MEVFALHMWLRKTEVCLYGVKVRVESYSMCVPPPQLFWDLTYASKSDSSHRLYSALMPHSRMFCFCSENWDVRKHWDEQICFAVQFFHLWCNIEHVTEYLGFSFVLSNGEWSTVECLIMPVSWGLLTDNIFDHDF